MSEQAKTEQDDAPREQGQIEPADLTESDLANVSGGESGSRMNISQENGGTGPSDL